MADTVSTKIYKDRVQENLRNRGQVDRARVKMSNYSVSDFAVGAGDTLSLKVAELPAGTILTDVSTNVLVANGAALTITVTDGVGSPLHANSFDMNATGGDYEPATTNIIDSATAVYVEFGNSADVNASVLDFEVTLQFYYNTWFEDEAGLTS